MVNIGSRLFIADFGETLEVSLPGSRSQLAAPTPIGDLGDTLAVGPNGFIYGQPSTGGIVEANPQRSKSSLCPTRHRSADSASQ